MSIRQRMCLAALFFSALLLAACGAKQGKNVRITADWNALYDAIPADATYAVGYQIDKKGDVPAVLQGALATSLKRTAAIIFSLLPHQDRRSKAKPAALKAKGKSCPTRKAKTHPAPWTPP